MSLLGERHGRVLLVTLNRPHRLNAYDRAMVDEVRETWTEFGRDDTLHAAVVTAAGTKGSAPASTSTTRSPPGSPAGPWTTPGGSRSRRRTSA